MKNKKCTSIFLRLGLFVGVVNIAQAEALTKGQYSTLDMSDFNKNSTHSVDSFGNKMKMICTNQFGQSFDTTSIGYNDCYSEYEASKNVREFKDKSTNPSSTISVGFTIK